MVQVRTEYTAAKAKLMDVAVIGGGPGGLMTTMQLNNKLNDLCDVTLFEASSRLGGKIASRNLPKTGALYEAGVAEFYDYSMIGVDPLRELIEDKLGLKVVPMDSSTVVMNDLILRNGEEIAQKFGRATQKAIDAFREKCSTLITPIQYYDSLSKDDNTHPWARRTGYDVLEKEIEDDTARKYIRIASHSDVAAAPHLTNGLTALKNYVMDVDGYIGLYSIVGGNERLTQELASRIRANVEFDSVVVKIGRGEDGRYELTINRDGQINTRSFDAVVVALPLQWLATLEWANPTLEGAMVRHVAHFDKPGHYLRITIAFETPFWRDHIDESWWMSDAFNGCCVYDEGSRHDVGSHGVLGWLITGNDALAMANLDDATLVKRALDSLPSDLHHGRTKMIEGAVQRWLTSVNAVPGGFPIRDTKTNHLPEPAEHPGLFIVGDYMLDSTVNGVFDSSDAATDLVMSHLIQSHAAKTRAARAKGPALLGPPRIDRDYFDDYRGLGPYSETWTHFFDADYLRDLIEIVWGKRRGYRLLDAGSADGRTVAAMRERGVEAWGVESNRLIHARTQPETERFNVLGDIVKLPFPDDHFDVVYETCLYHLPANRIDRAIGELHRVARHGVILGSVTSEIALEQRNKVDLTRGARTLRTLWEWSEAFFEHDFELTLENQELLARAWQRTEQAGWGKDKWYEDPDSLRFTFYSKVRP